MNILVVDDERTLRRTIRTAIESVGHQVAEAGTQGEALAAIDREQFDLVLLDLRLGNESGLDALKAILEASPGLGVVVITAYASVDTAVEAMRRGALDYLPKPFTPKQLGQIIDQWGSNKAPKSLRENEFDGSKVDATEVLFRTTSPAMRQVLDTVLAVAESDASILLRGESGTGKGVVARAIHERSRRADKPFVTIHCPSLSPHLLESELFGHAKGAFTGAVRSTEGKVTAADGGTLFLDEIGDLPLPLQPKLLRLVQDRTFERVGETKTHTADVRIVAATNRNIEEEVAAGRFREDLFYRLNVIDVTLPPLRERADDILPLAEELLARFNKRYARAATDFTTKAQERLAKHTWPGNIRELRNAVERAVLLCREGAIDAKDLPLAVGSAAGRAVGVGDDAPIDAVEIEHIRRVLATSPTLEEAARKLGIDASTLYRKRKRYGL